MADRTDDGAVSGDRRERDMGRSRRHIKPPRRYIVEDWVPLKPKATAEENDKQSFTGISSRPSKLSSHSNSGESGSSSKSS